MVESQRAINPHLFTSDYFNPESLYPKASPYMKLILTQFNDLAIKQQNIFQTKILDPQIQSHQLAEFKSSHPDVDWNKISRNIRFALDQVPIAYLAFVTKNNLHYPTNLMGEIEKADISIPKNRKPDFSTFDDIFYPEVLAFFAHTNHLDTSYGITSRAKYSNRYKEFKESIRNSYYEKYKHNPWFIGYSSLPLNVTVKSILDPQSMPINFNLKGIVHINTLGVIEPVLNSNQQQTDFKINIFVTPVQSWEDKSLEQIKTYTQTMGNILSSQHALRPTNDQIVQYVFGTNNHSKYPNTQ